MPLSAFPRTRAAASRRTSLVVLGLLAASCAGSTPPPRQPTDHPDPAPRQASAGASLESPGAPLAAPPPYFATLVQQARERAAGPHAPPAALPPDHALAQLTYDDHRRIRFRPDASLFRDTAGRFEAQFFHLGATSRTPIDVFVLEGAQPAPYAYDPASFAFDDDALPQRLFAPAYSGFRLHAPINTEAYRDEVIVFQGASYFRAVARGQAYGLSARGLAVDTGSARPEEFPIFDAFYLVPPAADDEHAWVLASLTSPSVAGAYAFRILPGEATVVEVTAHVFPRERVEVLGVAPLTSMFLFGEESPARGGDFRPEVHDSDVLLSLAASGEQLVRPLRNPARTTVSTLRLDSPLGFGLLQRDRAFDHYQDLEARYHERPSVWVEPVGDWGPGALRLLEIATELETDDNIAAMWVPDSVPDEGLLLRYRLSFQRDVVLGPGARVTDTRVARLDAQRARFVVDFAGPALADREGITVDVSARGGRVVESHVEMNPHTGGVRASFEVHASAPDVELRAFLRADDAALSETWSYLWQPTP